MSGARFSRRHNRSPIGHMGRVSARRLLWPIILVVLVGCTSTPSTDTSLVSPVPSPTIPPAPATCPKNMSSQLLRRNVVPGMTHSMVPGDPPVLVICAPPMMVPMGNGQRARIVIRDSSVAARIADELNRSARAEGVACPLYYTPPPKYGLFFNYTGGDVLLVTVGGCPMVTNGRSVGMGISILRLLHKTVRDASTT